LLGVEPGDGLLDVLLQLAHAGLDLGLNRGGVGDHMMHLPDGDIGGAHEGEYRGGFADGLADVGDGGHGSISSSPHRTGARRGQSLVVVVVVVVVVSAVVSAESVATDRVVADRAGVDRVVADRVVADRVVADLAGVARVVADRGLADRVLWRAEPSSPARFCREGRPGALAGASASSVIAPLIMSSVAPEPVDTSPVSPGDPIGARLFAVRRDRFATFPSEAARSAFADAVRSVALRRGVGTGASGSAAIRAFSARNAL
jgi:hypothetical protein